MKVSELIKQLSKYPQDMNVFGYDADPSTGKGVVDIELCVTPVFIDTYDQSVCIAYDTDYDIGYGQALEEIEERQGDTEVYDVLMVCNRKIDTNDLTKESA